MQYLLTAFIAMAVLLTAGSAFAQWSPSEIARRDYDFTLTPAEQAAMPIANADFEQADMASWTVEQPDLVDAAPGVTDSHAARLERQGETAGSVYQDVDVSAWQGQKVFFRFRARVEGDVVPYYIIESLDGAKSRVYYMTAKGEPSTILAELQNNGYWYYARYGWPANYHAPLTHRDDWQTVGSIMTIPQGVRRVRITLRPGKTIYNFGCWETAFPRYGMVTYDDMSMGLTREAILESHVKAATEQWAATELDNRTYFLLSKWYNEHLIALAQIDDTLDNTRTLLAQADAQANDTAPWQQRCIQLEHQANELRASLEGFRRFYEPQTTQRYKALDFANLEKEYPFSNAQNLEPSSSQLFYLHLYIERELRRGFDSPPSLAQDATQSFDRLDDDLASLNRDISQTLGIAAIDLPDTAAHVAKGQRLLPANGQTPSFTFVTGNTNFPWRIFRDLEVDLVSINYFLDFTDAGLPERPSISRIMQEMELGQLSAVFSSAHGIFTVSSEFMEANAYRLDQFVRFDAKRMVRFTTRTKKGKYYHRKANYVSVDEVRYDPAAIYLLPLNPLSPRGRDLIEQRMDEIIKHVLLPENREVVAAIEMSAEASRIVGGRDPWTNAGFAAFLQDTFGTIEAMNSALSTGFESFQHAAISDEASLETPQRARMERLRFAFERTADAEFYADMKDRIQKRAPHIAVTHRDSHKSFMDYTFKWAQIRDDYVNYHASYDRAHGYYLGKAIGKDPIIGEDNVGAPAGILTRETSATAMAKLKRTAWNFVLWGTKAICIWHPYAEPFYVSMATPGSQYTLITDNHAALPLIKRQANRFHSVLDGQIKSPPAAIIQFEGQGHIPWYSSSLDNFTQFLRHHHIDYGFVFEQTLASGQDSLDDYKLLAVPTSLFVSEDLQQQLLDWVNAGGVLVTFGPLGLYNQHAQPSAKLLTEVFGQADYHLVGSTKRVRDQEGHWHIAWEKRNDAVTSIEVNNDTPWNHGEALIQKAFNANVMLTGFDGEIDPSLRNALTHADYGKGRVIFVPREQFPSAYTQAMEQLVMPRIKAHRSVTVDDIDVIAMLRRPDDAPEDSGWYLFVQRTHEWSTPGSAHVSVKGQFKKVSLISGDRPVKWATAEQDGRTEFDVHLTPGQVAIFALTP